MGILQHTILERSGRLPSVIQLGIAIYDRRCEAIREVINTIAGTTWHIKVISARCYIRNLPHQGTVGIV